MQLPCLFVCLFSSTMATLSFTNHFHNFRIHPGNGAWFYSNSFLGILVEAEEIMASVILSATGS